MNAPQPESPVPYRKDALMHCYNCGFEIKADRKIGRQDFCPKCASALHACRNCWFYSPRAYHECRETEAEWVAEKEAPNFCDYFEPSREQAKDADEKKSGQTLTPREAEEKLKRMMKDLERSGK